MIKEVYKEISLGSYDGTLQICINISKDKALKKLKKEYSKKSFKEIAETFEKMSDCFAMKVSTGNYLIYINNFKNDWYNYEILLHEINHVVHWDFIERGMLQEMEAIAYQNQYLFKIARRIIQNVR